MSAEAIDKQLKSGQFCNFYLFYGDNDYDKVKYCNAIVKKAVAAGSDSFNLHVFGDDNFTVSQFAAAVNNLPLMSPYKCVVFRDPDIDGLKAADCKELEVILKALPPECIVIFYVIDKKYNTKYARKSAKWKNILTIAQKSGFAAEMTKPSRTELIRILQKRARRNQCEVSEQALGYLIDTCGQDAIALLNEFDKISAYACSMGRAVEKDDIDALAVRPLDSSVYDLSRAVSQGRLRQAMLTLDELFYMKVEPVIILSALSGEFCDLYRAKTALNSKAAQADVETDFQYRGREFRVRNAMRDCRALSEEYLSGSLELLMKADTRLKSSRADSRTVLEQLLVEMSEAGKKEESRPY